MYCRNCGAQIDDNDIVCPYCGTAQQAPMVQDVDSGSVG